jgi:hypothetical protein
MRFAAVAASRGRVAAAVSPPRLSIDCAALSGVTPSAVECRARMSSARPTSAGLVLTLILLGLTAGCTGDTAPADPAPTEEPAVPVAPSAPPQASCSAAGSSALPDQRLPEPVASMRTRIAGATAACDFAALERLALAGSGGFSFTFGGAEEGPAAYWRRIESDGEGEPLALLLKVLASPHATTDLPAADGSSQTLYVWPAAATKEVPTEEDWAAVESIYPAEVVARMKEDTRSMGIGYLGYRAGITAEGDWIYFVAGD